MYRMVSNIVLTLADAPPPGPRLQAPHPIPGHQHLIGPKRIDRQGRTLSRMYRMVSNIVLTLADWMVAGELESTAVRER